VEFDGHKLYLATVTGPVLVVDKIVSYKPLWSLAQTSAGAGASSPA
jgi:hypothetical protein